ncbi:hypothetical protein TNCV_2731541, partial [Trichonephila clavipes]
HGLSFSPILKGIGAYGAGTRDHLILVRMREAERDICDLPIRRVEGRVVDSPLVFKRVFFRRREKTRERSPALDGEKGKSPALDRESMRGEPWLERTGESAKEVGVERKTMNTGGVENRI